MSWMKKVIKLQMQQIHPHRSVINTEGIQIFLRILESKDTNNVSSWINIFNICASCQIGKGCKHSFGLYNELSKHPFEKIY